MAATPSLQPQDEALISATSLSMLGSSSGVGEDLAASSI